MSTVSIAATERVVEPKSNRSPSINKIAGALAKAQRKFQAAQKDASNPHFNASYADLTSVWEACGDALNENEIAVSQLLNTDERGEVTIETLLLHSSGEWLSSRYPVRPAPNFKGGPPGPQQYGSAITYARRYSLAAIAGVVTSEVDDDGESAMGREAPAVKSAPKSNPKPAPTPAAGKIAPKGSVPDSVPPEDLQLKNRIMGMTEEERKPVVQLLTALLGQKPKSLKDAIAKLDSQGFHEIWSLVMVDKKNPSPGSPEGFFSDAELRAK